MIPSKCSIRTFSFSVKESKAARGKDHMSFVGWLEKKEDFEAFYRKMYTDVSSVPTINK